MKTVFEMCRKKFISSVHMDMHKSEESEKLAETPGKNLVQSAPVV